MSDTLDKDLRQQSDPIREQFDIARYYDLIMESVTDVIGIGTRERGILYMTPSFTKEAGMSVEEIVNKNMLDLAHAEDISKIMDAVAKLERDNEVTLTWRCKTKDGYHWVETIVKNVACADDECVYKVISSRNIQKRMELETELLKTSEELYNLNQMKDKLFSIIAHDLKSPICSLITMTDFIQQEINTLSKPEIGEFVMSVNDAAKSSLSLLENLLEWTKSQTGAIRYSPEKVKIENVVNECWILAKSQALNKNISCKPAIESNLYAFADYKMFCTVIRNLISNAIKFTKQNGLIEITAFTEKNRVMVIIKDNGIGMNQDLVEFLFQKNPQKQISDDNFKQSRGLGLILCREFMDAQGGSITANSIPGQGSTIFLTLPLSENIDTE